MYNKANKKVLLMAVILFVLSIAASICKDELKLIIRAILEWKGIHIIIWLTVFSSFLLNYTTSKNTAKNESLIFTYFGRAGDTFFTALTFATIMSSSVSLIKGLYIQLAYGKPVYFLEFGIIDICSIIVTSSILLFYSSTATLRALIDAIYTANSSKITINNG